MAFRSNKSFRSIIDDLGLSAGLQLCLDAGDIVSVPGSGVSKWLDRAQGYDFFLGPTVGVEATDPTFVGTAGDLKDSTYWLFDGTMFFRYDTANEAWMQSLHKAGAKFSMACWVYFGALGSVAGFCGTRGAFANTGMCWNKTVGNGLSFTSQNAGVVVLQINSTATANADSWVFMGLSVDEAAGAGGGVQQLNDVQQIVTSTYVSPSAANASFTMEVGARGNADSPMSNLSRMGAMMMWNRALSAAELMALYQYPGVAFSNLQGITTRNVMTAY